MGNIIFFALLDEIWQDSILSKAGDQAGCWFPMSYSGSVSASVPRDRLAEWEGHRQWKRKG